MTREEFEKKLEVHPVVIIRINEHESLAFDDYDKMVSEYPQLGEKSDT